MKTLKESILADIENSIDKGDDHVAIVEDQFNQLSKDAIKKNNYVGYGENSYGTASDFIEYTFGKYYSDYNFGELFSALGYDCDYSFSIKLKQPIDDQQDWIIKIVMASSVNGDFKAYPNYTRYEMALGKAKSLIDAINKYIKPAFKNIKAFKKFLNDVEKNSKK
jgi:hypothetical protein